MVLVPQVDVAGVNAHHHGGDQHAFQEAVGIALKISAVLKGARLALVNIDGHEFGRGLIAHDAPFAPGRETCATQATQARVFHGLNDLLGVLLARGRSSGQCITTLCAVSVQAHIGRSAFNTGCRGYRFFGQGGRVKLRFIGGMGVVFGMGLHRLRHRFHGRKWHGVLVNRHCRRLLTAADAGSGHHAHIVTAQDGGQAGQQVVRARKRAAQTVADAHGQARRYGVAFQYFEVVIESCHLIHRRHRNIHFLGQCHQMAVMQRTKVVVEHMQVFNQQVTPVRPGAQQCANLGHGRVVGLPTFEFAFAADALAHIVHGCQGNGGAVRRGGSRRIGHRVGTISRSAPFSGTFNYEAPAMQKPCTAGAGFKALSSARRLGYLA